MNRRVALPETWISHLRREPESGMGFQRVSVALADGTKLDECLVFNAEFVELPQPYTAEDIVSITLRPSSDATS